MDIENLNTLSDEEFSKLNLESTDSSSEKSNNEESTQIESSSSESEQQSDNGTEGVNPESSSTVTEEPEVPFNYEEAYKALLQPIKADGQMIEIKDAKELISLAQKGVNFHRKSQQLAPHRKAMLLLEQHGLLDQTKLTTLIDLHNGNPEAIKKFLQDHKVDPLAIDMEEQSSYQPQLRSPTDSDVNFNDTLKSLQGSDAGHQVLKLASSMDQGSQAFLYENPNVLSMLKEHIESGMFSKIENEINRRVILGQIPENTPYIQMYGMVSGEFEKEEKAQVRQPVETKAVTKPATTDTSKVKAAAPTKTGSTTAKPAVDFKNISDADFDKVMNQLLNK